MNRISLALIVSLTLGVVGINPQSVLAVTQKPTVALQITYDPTVGQTRAEATSSLIGDLARNRADWTLVRPVTGMAPAITARSTDRRSLVAWTRAEGAEYGAYIRISKQQSIYSSPWIAVEALTVSADSGLFVSITEAAWAPEDTLARRRQVELLLNRLVPLAFESICYYELVDAEAKRDDTGAITRAGTGLRVLGRGQEPVADARIRGHWMINANWRIDESVTTDELGETRVHFVADSTGEPVGNADFTVDTVHCPNATYDPQWPQREMAEALAVLENARADLDEDGNYDDAIDRTQRFLTYDESNIAWFAPLMYPINAPNRRQQAELILRRARAERTRVEGRTGIPTIYRPNWMYRLWGAIGLRENEEEFSANSSDGTVSQPIGVDNGVPFGLGIDVRRRLVNNFWIGGGGSWEASRLTVSTGSASHKSQLRLWVLSAAMRYMRGEANRIAFYAEGGLRANHRTVTGPTYVANGRLYDTQADAAATGGTVLQFDTESSEFYPGLTFAAGFGIPMADFDTVWANIDVSFNVDRLPSGRSNTLGMLRLGATLRR